MEKVKRWFRTDRFAKRTNVRLISVSPGKARAKMRLHSYHWNGVGTAMGGAIFTLADFAFAAAANSHGTVALAINVSITFMKSARTGTLWADAWENSRNSKLGCYTVEVKNDQGDLVAMFQGMVYRKRQPIPA
jgi:acyl-CoA thioesterase